jgi:hypothetical protein
MLKPRDVKNQPNSAITLQPQKPKRVALFGLRQLAAAMGPMDGLQRSEARRIFLECGSLLPLWARLTAYSTTTSLFVKSRIPRPPFIQNH